MKYLLIFLLIPLNGLAQFILPRSEEQPVWTVTRAYNGPDPMRHRLVSCQSFTVIKDTSVCGQVFGLLGYRYFDGPVNAYNDFMMRQDGDQGFARFGYDCSIGEYLLYDYSAEPGDTLISSKIRPAYPYNKVDTLPLVIMKKEIKTICGKSRRVIEAKLVDYYLGFFYAWSKDLNITWIEGVGSNIGPIYNYHEDDEESLVLESFLSKTEMCPMHDRELFCDIMSNNVGKVHEKYLEQNVFSEKLIISPKSIATKEICVIGLDGKVLERHLLSDPHGAVHIGETLKCGMYLLKAETDHGTFTERILKVDLDKNEHF